MLLNDPCDSAEDFYGEPFYQFGQALTEAEQQAVADACNEMLWREEPDGVSPIVTVANATTQRSGRLLFLAGRLRELSGGVRVFGEEFAIAYDRLLAAAPLFVDAVIAARSSALDTYFVLVDCGHGLQPEAKITSLTEAEFSYFMDLYVQPAHDLGGMVDYVSARTEGRVIHSAGTPAQGASIIQMELEWDERQDKTGSFTDLADRIRAKVEAYRGRIDYDAILKSRHQESEQATAPPKKDTFYLLASCGRDYEACAKITGLTEAEFYYLFRMWDKSVHDMCFAADWISRENPDRSPLSLIEAELSYQDSPAASVDDETSTAESEQDFNDWWAMPLYGWAHRYLEKIIEYRGVINYEADDDEDANWTVIAPFQSEAAPEVPGNSGKPASAIPPPLPIPPSADDERDKWLYDQALTGATYGAIMRELSKLVSDKGWGPITTENGVSDRVKNYATLHGLPVPTRRRIRKGVV